MRTYPEALAYLNQYINYERTQPQRYAPETLSLDRVNHLLDRLGRPDRAYRAIHIAGTKGKGSTAAMIESCLRAAGYRTGFYSSPHLHTFRERMRVNAECISRETLAQLVDELEPHVKAIAGATWFEVVTALAFTFFTRSAIDVAVLEVGLGGRFDATNVVTPIVSVITSLSMDHMNLLGNTLQQIAFEKAGIIKPDVPIVSAPQQPTALAVIERTAEERHAPLFLVDKQLDYKVTAASLSGQEFQIMPIQQSEQTKGSRQAEGKVLRIAHGGKFRIPLLGAHQVTNAVTAITALSVANQYGITIHEDAIRRGLAQVTWPGRLEILNRDPLVVVDGAHNADSAQKLAQSLPEVFGDQNWTLIIGISADKDIPAILDALVPGAVRVILTRARTVRAADIEALAVQMEQRGIQPTLANDVGAALELAWPDRNAILVTGSLFTVADAREAWFKRSGIELNKD